MHVNTVVYLGLLFLTKFLQTTICTLDCLSASKYAVHLQLLYDGTTTTALVLRCNLVANLNLDLFNLNYSEVGYSDISLQGNLEK
jgi:hypothetical protein